MAVYRDLAITVLLCSAATGEGMDELLPGISATRPARS